MKRNMLLKVNSIVIVMLALHLNVLGQKTSTDTTKWDLGMEGMIVAAYGKDLSAFALGGPSLFLRLNKQFKIGVSALPSLTLVNSKWGVRLGIAPRIDIKKKWVLIAPLYSDNLGGWLWTFGIGYKF